MQLDLPSLMTLLLACCLIALKKNPGVGPIGIGDTTRRIIAKAILIMQHCTEKRFGQGDPLAMPMYALATIYLQPTKDDVSQVWYRDDISAADTINSLHKWSLHLVPCLGILLISPG